MARDFALTAHLGPVHPVTGARPLTVRYVGPERRPDQFAAALTAAGWRLVREERPAGAFEPGTIRFEPPAGADLFGGHALAELDAHEQTARNLATAYGVTLT